MADETRRRVLYAAGPIFAEKGFVAATVREICAAAGTNQAAINYHFGDKETLYLEVVRLAHRLRMEQTPPAEWPADSDPADKLRIFVRTTLTRMLKTPDALWPMRLMMREMLQPTMACQPLVEEFIRPQLEQLLEILDELLPPETPPYRRQQFAFSVIGQCLHYRVAGEFVALLISPDDLSAHFSTEQLVEHITAFSLAALCEFSRSAGRSRSSALGQR